MYKSIIGIVLTIASVIALGSQGPVEEFSIDDHFNSMEMHITLLAGWMLTIMGLDDISDESNL